ncbi:MAG: alpha-galactosidase [Candidatus Dormiibacterota bacterium]
MSIDWDAEARECHLHNGRVSYLLRVFENGALGHLHFGAPLAVGRPYAHLGPLPFTGFSNRLDAPIPFELPTPGSGDFRVPGLVVELADGSTVLDLRYAGHHIVPGKPPLAGLPATYVEDPGEASTLEVRLLDEPFGLEVELSFTVFRDLPVIARHTRLRNRGSAPVRVQCAMSAVLDLPDAIWEAVQLGGTWGREFHLTERSLVPGRQAISSVRGASGHEHNPFLLLRRPPTTEESGEAIGLSLVYSGNFLLETDVGPFATTRARIGINPEGFAWTLAPGDELTTPEAVLAHTRQGLGDLSDTYHRLYRERLARGVWRDRQRPIVLNNWEATYFDFTEQRLLELATAARELGVELFMLDDGWFGRRDDDTTSLGDWFVDERKLPGGLGRLGNRIRALGLDFGIWIEPEMVNRQSRLFSAHPEWVVGVPGRAQTESRNQLVLDLSRPAVVDHLTEVLSHVLRSGPISYVKWDMNRNVTEPYSTALPPDRQGEFFHRYTLGLYDLYRRLTEAFPDVLFESCASGGGRFDPGLLAYAPQTWTSDDTDAIERLKIQWGASLAYPLSATLAQVSAVPNHQIGRSTPLETRAAVAFFGVFGVTLDPTRLAPGERDAIAEQIAFYKARRELFQRGRHHRLRSPFHGDGNETAWMVVDAPAQHAVVGHYRTLSRPSPIPGRLPLRGLDPMLTYRVAVWPARGDAVERANEGLRGGDELMSVGLVVDTGDRRDDSRRGDFSARLFDLEAT